LYVLGAIQYLKQLQSPAQNFACVKAQLKLQNLHYME